jgi:uncharacterized protein YggE
MDVRTITTIGTGTAEAVPDAVAIVLTMEVDGATPAEALRACEQAQAAVIAALGVTATAGGLSVQPSWDQERQRPGRPQAVSTVTARLPELEAAGDIVTAALEAGGKAARLQSLVPVVTDASRPRDRARQHAFAEARRSAEQYAVLAGGRLGGLVHLSEPRGFPDQPMVRAAAVVDTSFAVADGPQDVVVSLTATWELTAD